jgi:phytoene synthase
LPAQWLREAGLDVDAWRRAPAPNDALARVTARVLDTADDLYRRADAGIAALPADCRVAIRAARLIYSDIGRVIVRARYDNVTRRASVSTSRKLWLLLRAMMPRKARDRFGEAPLDATRFLVEAAA